MSEIDIENITLEGDLQDIAEMQADEENSILDRENVVGLGVGTKTVNGHETEEPCLTVFVSHKVGKEMVSVDNAVPANIGKFKTDVVATGDIFAGCCNEEETSGEGEDEEIGVETLRGRVRPAKGGYSVGHNREQIVV